VSVLTLVCAPSRATPQMRLGRKFKRRKDGSIRPATKSRADFRQAARLAGRGGIAGSTEIMRSPWRRAWRQAFHQRAAQPTKPCMSPQGWGADVEHVSSRAVHGCGAVLGVNSTRNFLINRYKVDGRKTSVISVHMNPAVPYIAGNVIQRLRQATSRTQWADFEAAILKAAEQEQAWADIVVIMGDLNRSDYTFPGFRKVSPTGGRLIYVGIWTRPGLAARVTRRRLVPQNADHEAQVIRLALVDHDAHPKQPTKTAA
jgi:hypothetical protein